MPPVRFEPEMPASKQAQNSVLDWSTAEIGLCKIRAKIPYIVQLNFMSEVLHLSSNVSYIAGIKSSVIN